MLMSLVCVQEADPDSFENWEALIKSCEGLDGGLNRNSSPQALALYRDAYDRFLHKFPLFFGYWKKYADAEFNIAGPESAELVRCHDSTGKRFIQDPVVNETVTRSTSEAARAFPTPSTCGQTSAPSKWKSHTIHSW
jgi:hypothetical protein